MMKNMVRVEENKKKEGIGVYSETKQVAISAFGNEVSDDPKPPPDLHDVLDEILEASDKIQADLAVIKQNI